MKYYVTQDDRKIFRVRDEYISPYFWDGKRWGSWFYLQERPFYWGEMYEDLNSMIELTEEECYNKINKCLMLKELKK